MEAEVLESGWAIVGIGVDIADKARWTAGIVESFDLVFVEHHRARVDESFDIVGWEFGGHDSVVVLAASFVDVPVDSFEGSSFEPKPPEVFAGFFARRSDVVVIAVGV